MIEVTVFLGNCAKSGSPTEERSPLANDGWGTWLFSFGASGIMSQHLNGHRAPHMEGIFDKRPLNFLQVVKNGVAQAQEELRKEADNQIWQEGILR